MNFTGEQVREILRRIETELAKRKIAKYEFYAGAGISSALYSTWNTGKSKPSMNALAKVADYIGVPLDYLLYGQKETAPPEEDGDVMKIREMLKDRPDARLLFSAAEDAPTSAILEAAALIMRYKEESQNK